MLYLCNNDDHMIGTLKKTDEFLKAHKEIIEKINLSIGVARSLLEIVPITPENAMSGHLFPLGEAEDEFECSIQFCKLGFYKHAIISLRHFLELGLLSVYYDIDDKSHISIQDWLHSKEDTPYARTVLKKLKTNTNIAEFDVKFSLLEETYKCYSFLCNFTHTKGYRYSSKRLSRSNVNNFQEKAFLKWLDVMIKVLSLVVTFHILKYPLALQNTPLYKKFGLNPPAGGFLEPNQVDNFKKILSSEWIVALQQISDNDSDAVGKAEWVNTLPDINESEIEEQIEREEKRWIEMQGFERWEKDQDTHLKYLKEQFPSEYESELLRIDKIKIWAKENNLLSKGKVYLQSTDGQMKANISESGNTNSPKVTD